MKRPPLRALLPSPHSHSHSFPIHSFHSPRSQHIRKISATRKERREGRELSRRIPIGSYNSLTVRIFFSVLFIQEEELHYNVTAGIVLSDHSLVLQSITRESAGKYSCTAVNVEGRASSNVVNLEVMCEYIIVILRGKKKKKKRKKDISYFLYRIQS